MKLMTELYTEKTSSDAYQLNNNYLKGLGYQAKPFSKKEQRNMSKVDMIKTVAQTKGQDDELTKWFMAFAERDNVTEEAVTLVMVAVLNTK